MGNGLLEIRERYFMTANVIFDSRSPDDYQRLLGEFSEQGIADFKFWDAVCNRNSVIESINASHKMIVRDAKERHLDKCLLMEQDLYFTAPGAWKYFLDNEPKDYDVYLGATYIIPISNNKICGFHCYMVKEKFYDAFLSVPDDAHIDTAVGDLKGDYYFCYPFPALQRPGFSFNNKDICNYNSILKSEDIWISS